MKRTRQHVAPTRRRTRSVTLAAYVLTGTLLWAVWNESAAPHILLQGGLLSWLALTLSSRVLLQSDYPSLFHLHPLTLIRYMTVLVIAIFQSGIHAIRILVTGRMHLGIIDLPTNIKDPFHGVMVANAITLTPGTVTVEFEKGRFKVIWIDCRTTDPQQASEQIKGRFERVFLPLKPFWNRGGTA